MKATRSERAQRRQARQRNQRILVIVIFLVIVAAGAYWAISASRGGGEPASTGSGLKIEDLVGGTGAEAKAGDTVSVHYTGWLINGTEFDSSLKRGQPFEFTLGQGRVIQGWDEGVAGMKVGGKRKLTIPPELGYGARGSGSQIPPNSTLVFEVELLEIK